MRWTVVKKNCFSNLRNVFVKKSNFFAKLFVKIANSFLKYLSIHPRFFVLCMNTVSLLYFQSSRDFFISQPRFPLSLASDNLVSPALLLFPSEPFLPLK